MTDRRDALDEAIDRAAAAWLEPSPDPLFAARVLAALPAGARVPMWRAWWWQAAAATVAAIAVTAYLPSRSADAVPVIASPLARMAPLAVVVADRPGAERAAGLPVQPGSRAVRPVMVEAAAPGGQQGIAPLPLPEPLDVGTLDVASMEVGFMEVEAVSVAVLAVADVSVSPLALSEPEE